MLGLQKLKNLVRDGLAILKRDKSLIEGTVYASANRRVVGRLVYTHHFPCQGLQEPKSDDDFGVSVQGYFRGGPSSRFQRDSGRRAPRVGFGHIANDVSLDAVKRALERAKANAIYDPDFHGCPRPEENRGEARPAEAGRQTYRAYADPRLLSLTPEKEATLLADISWNTLEGAFRVFRRYHQRTKTAFADPDFIVSGDNFLMTERAALASTTGVQFHDESTITMSLISAMVERAHSKGRGWGAESGLAGFDPGRAGEEAASAAVRGIGGTHLPTGNYSVILGPQAATEIFANLLLSSFSAGTLDFRLSIFNGRFGGAVASPLLDLYDDATHVRGAGSKTFTDDGYRTKRIPLIERGRFVGFLRNDYYGKKFAAQSDDVLKEKIGEGARAYLAGDASHSGFRFGGGGGRVASHEPGISATNLFVSTAEPVSRNELLRRVKNGVYIGALWYTYPIAGYKAGEISGTAVADTFRIRNGKIAEPIRVNSLRIHANLRDIVKNIIGITGEPRPTILWASDEITYAPEVGIADVHLEAIRHDEA